MAKIINHSNRQPISNKLIVFLDRLPNINKALKGHNNTWYYKESDIIATADDKMREEMARKSTDGIILAIGKSCFKDIHEDEKPIIGDRVTFTSYSGMHKVEGDNFYRSLQDTEIHDYYIPQREQIINKKD